MRGNLVLGMVRGGGEFGVFLQGGGDVIRRYGTVELPVSREREGFAGVSRFNPRLPCRYVGFCRSFCPDTLGFSPSLGSFFFLLWRG